MSTPPIHPPRSLSLEVVATGVYDHGVTFERYLERRPELDESDRTVVEQLIDVAFRAVERNRGAVVGLDRRMLAVQTYRETFGAGGGTSLPLSSWPVDLDQPFAVVVEGEEIDSTAYVVCQKGRSSVWRKEGWRAGAEVTYTAGVPASDTWRKEWISEAILLTIGHQLARPSDHVAERSGPDGAVKFRAAEEGFLTRLALEALEGV